MPIDEPQVELIEETQTAEVKFPELSAMYTFLDWWNEAGREDFEEYHEEFKGVYE